MFASFLELRLGKVQQGGREMKMVIQASCAVEDLRLKERTRKETKKRSGDRVSLQVHSCGS